MVCRSARISSVLIVSMSDLGSGAGEHPDDLADRVGLADVGEELVAEALALGGALDDAGDVQEVHRRRDDLLRVEQLGQCRQPRVRHADHPDVRLDRGEGVVRREDVVLRQCVEKSRLAHVGQADDADLQTHDGQV
jgi:GAF domain-containing protein